MKYPVLYTIEIYIDSKIGTLSGIFYAENFAEAAKYIEKFYGEDNIVRMDIELFEDGPIEIPKHCLDLIKNILNEDAGEVFNEGETL